MLTSLNFILLLRTCQITTFTEKKDTHDLKCTLIYLLSLAMYNPKSKHKYDGHNFLWYNHYIPISFLNYIRNTYLYSSFMLDTHFDFYVMCKSWVYMARRIDMLSFYEWIVYAVTFYALLHNICGQCLSMKIYF